MNTSRLTESHLIELWRQGLGDSSHLTTADGRKVEVLSPGIPNADAGPDFIDATIRIGGTIFRGDVEIHVESSSWIAHSHHSDPHYNRVILHVVQRCNRGVVDTRTASGRRVPLLCILPGPTSHVLQPTPVPSSLPGGGLPCTGLASELPDPFLLEWVKVLSFERLESKILRFRNRLQDLHEETSPDYGGLSSSLLWDQLLYEGLMEGLGLLKNRRPFLRLARSLRLHCLRRLSGFSPLPAMAALFGTAGLLPSRRTLRDRDSRRYVQCLRRNWRTLRPLLHIPMLHRGDWVFFRLRPSGFPTARLASMCFLLQALFDGGALRQIVALFQQEGFSAIERERRLRALFVIEPDSFWSTHLHFGDEGSGHSIALGRTRVTELIVNCIIPVAILYGRIFETTSISLRAFQVYENLAGATVYRMTRRQRQDIVAGRAPLSRASIQQGILQLEKNYCARRRCVECRIGAAIRMQSLEKSA